jgi:hypothetical protein
MVKKVAVEKLLGQMKFSPSVVKALVGSGKHSKTYAVWAASWDLRVPNGPTTTRGGHLKFKDARQKKQWETATAVRVRLWAALKHRFHAQQHHQSFWLFPLGLEENTDKVLVDQLFKQADDKLIQAGLMGSRYTIFPLVTDVQVEVDIAQTFRGGLLDDLGRLTSSFDSVNQDYNDVQSIGDDEWDQRPPSLKGFDTKADALKDLAKKGERLAGKLRTYIEVMEAGVHSDDMAGLQPQERADIDQQVESLKKNLPVITGRDVLDVTPKKPRTKK